MVNDTKFVKGAEKLSRRIATIRNKLDLPPLVEEIGGLLLKRTRERFDKQVDPDERPWADLAPVTIKIRRRLGYGPGPKLRRTGQLREAIQLIRGRADGGIFTNTGAGIRIGVIDPEVVEKARALNRGTSRIPARRFLGISRLDVKAVDSFLRRIAERVERDT